MHLRERGTQWAVVFHLSLERRVELEKMVGKEMEKDRVAKGAREMARMEMKDLAEVAGDTC